MIVNQADDGEIHGRFSILGGRIKMGEAKQAERGKKNFFHAIILCAIRVVKETGIISAKQSLTEDTEDQDLKQERAGSLQVPLRTGPSSTPTTVWVRLHQIWQGVACSGAFSAKASSGVRPVYMDLVRKCRQNVFSIIRLSI